MDEVKGAPVGEVVIYVADFELAVCGDETGLYWCWVDAQDLDTQLVNLDK